MNINDTGIVGDFMPKVCDEYVITCMNECNKLLAPGNTKIIILTLAFFVIYGITWFIDKKKENAYKKRIKELEGN